MLEASLVVGNEVLGRVVVVAGVDVAARAILRVPAARELRVTSQRPHPPVSPVGVDEVLGVGGACGGDQLQVGRRLLSVLRGVVNRPSCLIEEMQIEDFC